MSEKIRKPGRAITNESTTVEHLRKALGQGNLREYRSLTTAHLKQSLTQQSGKTAPRIVKPAAKPESK